MATKTISLELDTYEKLRGAKKPGESFSEVVRRAVIEDSPLRARSLRDYLASGGSGVSNAYLDAVEDSEPRPEGVVIRTRAERSEFRL